MGCAVKSGNLMVAPALAPLLAPLLATAGASTVASFLPSSFDIAVLTLGSPMCVASNIQERETHRVSSLSTQSKVQHSTVHDSDR